MQTAFHLHTPATSASTVIYLGIDIAKATFAVALLDGTGSLATGEFANTAKGFKQVQKWYTKHLNAYGAYRLHACMEATGRYGDDLATALYESFTETEHRLSIVNPHLTSAHAKSRLQRNKTDKLDAENIAHFCATHHPDAWQPPTEQQRTLKELTRHQETTEKNLTQEKNRLQSGIKDAAILKQIKKHIRFLEEQLAETKTEVEHLLKHTHDFNTATALLVSIPGVGLSTAARFLAELPHLKLFDTSAQLVAYAGLSPAHNNSGTSIKRKGKLSKKGNQHLRTALYMPTLSAMRWNPLVKALTDRLIASGKPKMVALIAGMRKLLQLMFGVLKSGQPFNPNYAKSFQNT